MPRKKQKGPPSHSNRRGGGPKSKPGSTSTQSQSKGSNLGSVKDSGPKKQPQQNQRPIVPFLRGDRILLIGEGDFSFARSLAKQYKCRKLCATCYDSKETLFEKYPQAEQNIEDILHSAKSKSQSKSTTEDMNERQETNPESSETKESTSSRSSGPRVIFSIDARKLGAQGGGGKEVKTGFSRKERKLPPWKVHQQPHQPTKSPGSHGPWDVICFNFPHVGGLSTDVNRQVRANQELLVGFFKSCVPLLSAAPDPKDSDDEWEDEEDGDEGEEASDNEDEDVQTSGKGVRTGPGQILVSLFEAEPYTLWNIKDLARHAGLQVVTSFRFPWTSYEGYSHARTLGEVEGKDGGRGGWRGEDREARMYVFEVKPEPSQTGKKAKKRARDDSSDSE